MAHDLTRRLAQVRKEGILDFLLPDGKSQVTLEYENGKPKRVDTIVISSQHTEWAKNDRIREGIIEEVIRPVIDAKWLDGNTRFLINPTGRFVIGGPKGDSGLTGRKIIADLSLIHILFLLPHTGGETEEAYRQIGLGAAQGVLEVLSGRAPSHWVNPW